MSSRFRVMFLVSAVLVPFLLQAAPANDDFAGRIPLTGLTPNASGSNLGATRQPGEPVHPANPGGKSVWWTWTAPADGGVFVTTRGSDFDTLLAVYTNSTLATLGLVAANDDEISGTISTSRLLFVAQRGQAYQIMVDGYNGASGTIQLAIRETAVLSDTPRPDFAVTDGTIYTALATNGVIYLGGEFRLAGPSGGGGVALDRVTGEIDPAFPRIHGGVNTVISDGEGGLYIGGFFRVVGNAVRSNLVHILPDKTVDPIFVPNPQGEVWALALSENALYVGGAFTNVAGVLRTNLAALNPATGAATGWSPDPNGTVRSILPVENVVVIGGEFSRAGGVFRSGIAALFASTGNATGWNPGINGSVLSMLQLGEVLFVGGQFSFVGGQNRRNIAAIDIYTGFATSWNPDADDLVWALAATCDTVYAGGRFTTIGGQTRNYVAALDPVFGFVKNWNAGLGVAVSLESYVVALSVQGDAVYAAGHFASPAAESSVGLAALNAATGAVLDWSPRAGGTVRALQISGNQVYAGGPSLVVGGKLRNFAAALDQESGEVLDWDPNADGIVLSLAARGNRVYAGGFFTRIGGLNRLAIAALDLASGAADPNWNAFVQNTAGVWALLPTSQALYVGGAFSFMGGLPRQNIAALDLASGLAYSGWNPGTDGTVASLEISGNTLYLGGAFTQVNAFNRLRIAAVDAISGQVLSWSIFADNTVRKLTIFENNLYFGGDFTLLSDGVFNYNRQHLAAIKLTGEILAWNPGASAAVNQLQGRGNRIFVAGEFASAGGSFHNYAAELDLQTGAATSWDPGISAVVQAMAMDDRDLFLGGSFTTIGNQHRGGFVAFPPQGAPTILLPPLRQAVSAGSPVTLQVAAAGLPPLSYQWRLNGNNLSGQTAPTLQIPSAQVSDTGIYDVAVSNLFDTVLSDSAAVIAALPPIITAQPSDQTVDAGGLVQLQVSAIGNPAPRFQWRRNGRNIPGATRSTLDLPSIQPRDGGAYSVVVDNIAGTVSSADAKVVVRATALAFADNFSARGQIGGFSGQGIGNTLGATRESAEPVHAGKSGGRSIWVQWTAPASGVATFSTRGSGFDTLLAVYQGTSLAGLNAVTADDDTGGSGTSQVTFDAVSGTPYSIAIDGLGGAAGDVLLSWALDNARLGLPRISSQPLSQTVPARANATFSVGLAPGQVSCQWFFNCRPIYGATNESFTVTNVQPWKAGSYIVVVANNAGAIESVPAILEIGPDASAVSADKFLDVFRAGSTGGLNGRSPRPRPSFTTVSAGVLGTQTFNNFGATTEQGEPVHGDVAGGSSRWFGLVPTSDGQMTIDTIGSDFDTVLAVYTGASLFSLTLVTTDNNGAPDHIRSLVQFNARAGTNYLVAVDGVNGAQGNVKLNWILSGAPLIQVPPTNQTVLQGYPVSFSVEAASVSALTYQWRFNGAIIGGATNKTLILSNVQSTNAGSYSVVVQNSFGSVTNSAVLTVVVPFLPGSSARLSNGVFRFQFNGETNKAYVVESTTNWVNWVTLTNFVNTTGSRQLQDPTAGNYFYRYYRARTN